MNNNVSNNVIYEYDGRCRSEYCAWEAMRATKVPTPTRKTAMPVKTSLLQAVINCFKSVLA